jgi:hypothetical protein
MRRAVLLRLCERPALCTRPCLLFAPRPALQHGAALFTAAPFGLLQCLLGGALGFQLLQPPRALAQRRVCSGCPATAATAATTTTTAGGASIVVIVFVIHIAPPLQLVIVGGN